MATSKSPNPTFSLERFSQAVIEVATQLVITPATVTTLAEGLVEVGFLVSRAILDRDTNLLRQLSDWIKLPPIRSNPDIAELLAELRGMSIVASTALAQIPR